MLFQGLVIDIATTIMKCTVTHLFDQFVAGTPKDENIGSEKWREHFDKVVEDLKVIKTIIDGLAQKDLHASYAFLNEGIVAYKLALEEANRAQNDGRKTKTATSTTTDESPSRILNEATELSHALQQLKSASSGRFVRAENHFADARRDATRAFYNQALSLPDKIMAAQLRVVSKMLECLQDAKVAADTCMLFLKELHDLPAIRKTFSLYFDGEFKSRFDYLRLKNIRAVLALNFAISEFVAKFSGELPDVRNWPGIHLSTRDESLNPLLLQHDVLEEIFDKEEFQLPENHVFDTTIRCARVCVNSKGQLLRAYSQSPFNYQIDILSRDLIKKTFCFCADLIGKATTYGLIIDHCDNVYVWWSNSDKIKRIMRIVAYDSSGKEKYDYTVRWVESKPSDISCAVNNDDKILNYWCGDNCIHVIDKVDPSNISTLPIERDFESLECVTNQDEIVMRTEKCVFVLTKEGKIKRKINVEKDIESVAFNHVTSKIEVLVRNEESIPSYSILSYSENDEVEYSCYLPVKFGQVDHVSFRSHPAGHSVVVYSDRLGRYNCNFVFM